MAGLSGFLLAAAAAGRLKHALLLDTALNSYGWFSFSFINFSHGGGFAAELQFALFLSIIDSFVSVLPHWFNNFQGYYVRVFCFGIF